MHQWGDKNVDWNGIESAASYLGSYCRRWGRFGGQTKEKFGTVRFYAHFGSLSLHTIIYPGYYYSQFPTWLWKLDIKFIGPILNKLFGKIFFSWQKFIYNKAYQNALKKWPHLKEEILCCADHPEFINKHTKYS